VEELTSPPDTEHWMGDKRAAFYAAGVGAGCIPTVLLVRPGVWHYSSFME
jgi:hypothetical protein